MRPQDVARAVIQTQDEAMVEELQDEAMWVMQSQAMVEGPQDEEGSQDDDL